MAEFQGRLILLAVGDAATSEAFATVGGSQSVSISIDNEVVDVSNANDGIARKLLADAGNRSISISQNGVFQDDVAVKDMLDYAQGELGQSNQQSFRMTWPNGDIWDFEANVANFTMGGEHNAEQTYSTTLEVSGAIVIT